MNMTNDINRAFNFNAGPSALPLYALQRAQTELLDYKGTGMSVMEMSHRGKEYEEIHNGAIALLRELMNIPEDYEILFIQGGASLQFSMIPMNFLASGKKGAYILTGSWSEKALAEAKMFGEVYVPASGKDNKYNSIPDLSSVAYEPDTAYVHITSNNTIYGTQWQQFPEIKDIPLIADMSSDILSRPVDVSKFAMIYAGAQKNLGPSGVTLVIIKKSFLETAGKNNPTMLRYSTYAENNSLYNTPPCYSIYILNLVLQYAKENGGIPTLAKLNSEKAAMLYKAIDSSDGFYFGHAKTESRSLMNVVFRLKDEELEKAFLLEAKQKGFVGLAGHRSVGGCRASIYNAVPQEACRALKQFMEDFREKNS